MVNSKLKNVTDIKNNSKLSKWCYVNVDNEFEFLNNIYTIDESVKDYEVKNKYNQTKNYTNEAHMEFVLAVVNRDNSISFFNENYKIIEDSLVSKNV